jgi:hypothetical protein
MYGPPRSGILMDMSASDASLVLFDLPPEARVEPDEARKGPVRCSECPRMLTSKESIEAGIGPGCAAKLGRVVVAVKRRADRRRRRAQRAAAA